MSSGRGTRIEEDAAEVASFGPFRLFPAERRLERDGALVDVGGRALDILLELVKQAGKVVSKAELMAAIWTDITVVEGALRTHIYNLRRALGDGVGGVRYVTPVAGWGSCFVAPVLRGANDGATGAAARAGKHLPGLPPRLARMTGRDDVVRTLAGQVLEHRFVTILGAAGIGKTTVAVALAHVLLDEFGDAVRFIELGSLTDGALVAATIASTLGVPTQTDDVLDCLRAFLEEKRVLLVLDNCEHVVEAVAALAEHLFLRAPGVHLLATSREALRVEGEHAHRLAPLESPADVVGMSAEAVQRFPAVQVFLERAAASGWSGDLTDDDVPIVAETCKRLDGVPLAIELAASFVAQCGLPGMAAVLNDRLGLLWQRGRRTAPPRQQTLNALLAWSYDRLPEHERVVLRRLSVFVGTFSFEAAKAVALEGGDSHESLVEVMNGLVAKSLLSVSVEDGAVVYRLLETTRAYAFERLAEGDELETVGIRQTEFFTERLESIADGIGAEPLRQRASDLPNVRAALQRSFSLRLGRRSATRLAAAAATTLIDLGLVGECFHWCREALESIEAPQAGTLVELRLQEAMGLSALFLRGNSGEARVALDRGLELARAIGSGDDEVRMLEHLNVFLVKTGDFGGALNVAKQSIVPGRPTTARGAIYAQWMLGRTYHVCGDQALAQDHCEAGLRLAAASAEVPSIFIGHDHALITLARALWLRGHPHRAAAIANQLINQQPTMSPPIEHCFVLICCHYVFVWQGDWGAAQRVVDMMNEHLARYSLASYRSVAKVLGGEILVKIGRPAEGCDLLQSVMSTMTGTPAAALGTTVAGALSEGLAATGLLDEALATIEWALVESVRRGGTFDLPELMRLKARFVALRTPADARAVDEILSSAIELARRQGAVAWELRATTSLARERLGRGYSAQVLGDLSAVYAKFTDGMETPDLQAARSLLERRFDH
jgi:predicted ATPase